MLKRNLYLYTNKKITFPFTALLAIQLAIRLVIRLPVLFAVLFFILVAILASILVIIWSSFTIRLLSLNIGSAVRH